MRTYGQNELLPNI